MLTRFHKILLGLLAVQVGLAVYTSTRSDGSAPAKEKPLLVGYDADKVTRLQVASTTGAPVDLVKQGDGWVLASSWGYPADPSKVADALGALGRMAAAEPIATRAARHRQLEVDDGAFQRKLTVTADGKDLTVYVGGPAGARRTAVRTGGDKVFAVTGLSAYTYGSEARAWIEPSYLKIERDQVAKVTVARGASTVVLTRDPLPPAPPPAGPDAPPPPPAPTWSVSVDGAAITLATGETVDTTAIDRLVGHAATIAASEPADPGRAVATPTAVITIERTATGGATPAATVVDVLADGERYYVRERGASKAAMVDKYAIDDLVTANRATLVKAAAKPGATPPAGDLPPGLDLPGGLPGGEAPLLPPGP